MWMEERLGWRSDGRTNYLLERTWGQQRQWNPCGNHSQEPHLWGTARHGLMVVTLIKTATRNPIQPTGTHWVITTNENRIVFPIRKSQSGCLYWGKYLLRFQRRHPSNTPSYWWASVEMHERPMSRGQKLVAHFKCICRHAWPQQRAKGSWAFCLQCWGLKPGSVLCKYSSSELSSQPWGQEVPKEYQGWSGTWRPSSLSLFFLEIWGQFFFFMRSLILLPLVKINCNVLYVTN